MPPTTPNKVSDPIPGVRLRAFLSAALFSNFYLIKSFASEFYLACSSHYADVATEALLFSFR